MAEAEAKLQAHQQTRAQIDKAIAAKELGNAAFKANDLQTAIKHYYTVILNLKGISSSNSGLETMFNAARITSPTQPRFSEVTEEDEADNTTDEKNGHAEEEEPERGPTPPPEDETYTETSIKKVLSSSYVNMAICFAKKEEWSKCRRNAEGALALDPDNFKAAFRKAQATVRLGEVTRGRDLLLELQKKQNDAGIESELKLLEATEAKREKKAKDSLRGFMNKANPPKIQEIA